MKNQQTMIAELCNRFQLIFQDIKKIKQNREQLQEENKNLQQLIDKEVREHEREIEKLQQEIVDIQELEKTNRNKELFQEDIQKMVGDYEKQIIEQKSVLNLYKEKYDGLLKQNQQEKEQVQQLDQQQKYLEGQIELVETEITDCEDRNSQIQMQIQQNQSQINQYENSIQEILKNIEQNEQIFRQGIEEKFKKEEIQKQNQQEYRDILKENSNLNNKIKGLEKQIQRYSQDLESKVQRLEILLQQSQTLQQKINKNEVQKRKLEDMELDNQKLRNSNKQLREEIIALGGKLGEEFEIVVRRVASQKKQINQKRPSTANINQNSQQSVQQKQTQQKSGKFNLLQNKYYEELSKQSDEKDQQIIQNKVIIDNLKINLDRLKEQIYEQEFEKNRLLQ